MPVPGPWGPTKNRCEAADALLPVPVCWRWPCTLRQRTPRSPILSSRPHQVRRRSRKVRSRPVSLHRESPGRSQARLRPLPRCQFQPRQLLPRLSQRRSLPDHLNRVRWQALRQLVLPLAVHRAASEWQPAPQQVVRARTMRTFHQSAWLPTLRQPRHCRNLNPDARMRWRETPKSAKRMIIGC